MIPIDAMTIVRSFPQRSNIIPPNTLPTKKAPWFSSSKKPATVNGLPKWSWI
ncbi:hypothetical protein PICSAR205_04562 [Mycobacterium avium subsp. paratuberculosis]|nr:hypothetical protein PICSAR205_04562 [Mycobacterium avium subsp. paratuberculosis]